jgi:hypothetical protein
MVLIKTEKYEKKPGHHAIEPKKTHAIVRRKKGI